VFSRKRSFRIVNHWTALALAVVALAPRGALAQQPDTVARRDSTVRRDSTIAHLAPVEVHASIAPVAGPTIGSGVPARITTLSGHDIDAWEPRILPDVLGSLAGVSVYDDLGSQFKLNVSTRGFTAGPTVGLPPGISVFLDGVRQNEADAQEVDFDLLPMEHVKRVELLSGTASLLGPNSLGGAINLVTDRGVGPAHGELELSGGAYGQVEGEATVEGMSRTGWDYYLGGGYGREDGWRQGTNGKNFNGFLNLGHFGEERGFGVQAFGAKSRVSTAGSIPESLYGDPRVNFTPGDFEDLNTEQLNLTGYVPMGGGRGALTTYVRHYDADRFNVNQAPDPSVRAMTANYTLGATADWRRRLTVGANALSVRFGVDGATNWVHERIFNVPSDAGAGDDGSTITTDVRSPSWDIAAYGIADYDIKRVTLSAGARYDYIRIPFRNQIDAGDNTTNNFNHFSPRGGVSVKVGAGSSVYGSVGGSFRAPAIVELGCADPEATCPLPFALGDDPPLAPVRATTYEVGWRLLRGSVLLNASAYRTDVRDEIFFISSPQSLVSGYFTNLDRTRREGVELSLLGSLFGDRVSWYTNYAYTRATFQSPAEIFSIRSSDDFAGSPLAGANNVRPGDELPLIPANQVKGGFSATLPKGFQAGLDARYIGAQWLRGDEANETRALDGYVVFGARAGYTYGNWSISAIASNLFDNHDPVFGTFNENQQNGELERFLTPLNARNFSVVIRRGFGSRGGDVDD
jgi:iron complex outermembrane recepter protein